jgi:hypothetical protein
MSKMPDPIATGPWFIYSITAAHSIGRMSSQSLIQLPFFFGWRPNFPRRPFSRKHDTISWLAGTPGDARSRFQVAWKWTQVLRCIQRVAAMSERVRQALLYSRPADISRRESRCVETEHFSRTGYWKECIAALMWDGVRLGMACAPGMKGLGSGLARRRLDEKAA